MPTSHSCYIDCSGTEIHLTEWGQPGAPLVVMWHGLARTGRDFDELALALSDRYWIVCPDTVGRGLSQWAQDRDRDYCFATYTRIAADVIAWCGASSVRWVGTSMGGLIGIAYAAAGGPISHLVVNDVGPEVPEAAITRITSYVGAPPDFATMTEFEAWLRTVYKPFGANSDGFWRRMAETSCRRLPDGRITVHYDPKIVTQFTAHDGDRDLWAAWDALTCPTLLLRGLDSDVLPADLAQRMLDRNPGCSEQAFSGFGHAPTLADDDQIAAVAAFLSR
jgi:pimeloyl-ACP methyl ester carboxylesterase